MIEIDGSHGEGGGQIIRTAVALSALTKEPVKIFNIRNKRTNPGLRPQHMNAVKAVAELCNAETKGAEVGSTSLEFIPDLIESKTINIDIGTAGSIPMVLQALMPAALFSKKDFTFRIKGGTSVHFSPPIEYFQHVFCDFIKKMGADVFVKVEQHGFYPKGGGKVLVKVKNAELNPLELLSRGNFVSTHVYSKATNDLKKAQVAERQLKGFKKEFGETSYETTKSDYVESLSTGTLIHAHNHYEHCTIGAESLGKQGKPAEKVGEECAKKLKKEISFDSTLDSHMLDQIIPYMAVLGGKFSFGEMTSHAETNIWVTEKFLPVKFEINKNVISCKMFLKN